MVGETLTTHGRVEENAPSYWIVSIVVIIIIIGILVLVLIPVSPSEVIDSATLSCVAEKSTLYISTGCIYCDKQKRMLGEDLSDLHIIDCRIDPEVCTDINIEVVPSWMIEDELYGGFKSIDELKEITGC